MVPSAPRKTPRQARARLTVQRILDAARDLVAADGVAALTTNHVAERAGVNIATLYQYFPNKAAVLDALLAQYADELARALDAVLAALPDDAGIEQSTRAWTLGGIGWFRQTRGVLPELLQAAGSTLALPALAGMEHRLTESMRRFLVRRRDRLAVPNLDAAVYVAFHAATSVLVRHLLQPGWMTDAEIVDELVRLMTRYFGAGAPPREEAQ